MDETDGLVNATLEVVPDGLGLDGGDLEGLGHINRLLLGLWICVGCRVADASDGLRRMMR